MPDLSTAYSWAITTCEAPNVGYSQPYRNQETVNGITYYDCSSFLWYALLKGGFDVEAAYLSATGYAYSGNAIVTANERAWLLALGFTRVPLDGVWASGDILWRSGHTEMVYEGGNGRGITMGAHTANTSLENQVSINTRYSSSDNWSEIYRYVPGSPSVETGYSLEVISAICGNWYHESNINPGIYQGLHYFDISDPHTIGGYGLGQWTNNYVTGVDRAFDLYNYLTAHNYSLDSGQGQLEFFIAENVWYQTGAASAYSDLTAFLNSQSTDIDELTEAFMVGWEGINDGTLDARQRYAKLCYDYLLANGQNSYEWTAGNRWLSRGEILNNAVLVYQYLSNTSGGGSGGGGSPKPAIVVRSRMPLYMYIRRKRL